MKNCFKIFIPMCITMMCMAANAAYQRCAPEGYVTFLYNEWTGSDISTCDDNCYYPVGGTLLKTVKDNCFCVGDGEMVDTSSLSSSMLTCKCKPGYVRNPTGQLSHWGPGAYITQGGYCVRSNEIKFCDSHGCFTP